MIRSSLSDRWLFSLYLVVIASFLLALFDR